MEKLFDLKVGYLCNNHCVHCAASDYQKHLEQKGVDINLTTSQIYQLIDQNYQLYDTVVITGGEPTIRKDFFEILQYAASKFKTVSVQTNGRKLSNWPQLQTFSENNRITFAIAIHGSTSAIHDNITKVKHSWTQTINGIKFLNNRYSICGKIVITKHNVSDLVNITKLINSLNIKRINFAFVHGVGAALENIDTVLPSYDDVKKQINKALDICDKNNIFADLETIPYCVVNKQYYDRVCDINMMINNPQFVCKPVNDEAFDWNYSRVYENKCKFPCCDDCIMTNICEGVWCEYRDIHSDTGITPIQSTNNYKIPRNVNAMHIIKLIRGLHEYTN